MSRFREKWDNFVLQNPVGSFLQSFDWGVFQEKAGQKARFICMTSRKIFTTNPEEIKRLREKISSNLFLSALVLTHKLPFKKTYLYSPRGPVVDFLKFKKQKPVLLFQKFLQEIKKTAEEEKAIFFRIDPEWLGNEYIKEFLENLGFVKSSKEIQPRETIIVDLAKSEEGLLGEMHHKTRYNIKLAQRHGVQIKIRNPQLRQGFDGRAKSKIRNPEPEQVRYEAGKSQIQNSNFQNFFDEAWKLMQETAKRDKFRLHPREYYEEMLCPKIQNPKSKLQIQLFTAEYRNKIIAVNIVAFFGGRATYLHGASSYEYRNLMAPYLLHWEIIKEAKSRGCTEYDLWGISEEKWPGVTRFKRGFGGSEAWYIGAYDYVLDNKWFKLYKLGQGIKRTLP